jgi:hypothetical protein
MAQKAREEATLCNLGAFPAKASHQIVYHVNERPKFHSIKIKFALFFWFNVCIVIWFEQSEQTKKLNVYVQSRNACISGRFIYEYFCLIVYQHEGYDQWGHLYFDVYVYVSNSPNYVSF